MVLNYQKIISKNIIIHTILEKPLLERNTSYIVNVLEVEVLLEYQQLLLVVGHHNNNY